MDLFNHTIGLPFNQEKPRQASTDEVRAYCEWLARRDGIPTDDVVMPGTGALERVTLETLDDDGNVIRSSVIGLNSRLQIGIDKAAVRAVVGKVEKPRKVRTSLRAPEKPAERVEALPAPVAPVEALKSLPEASDEALAPKSTLPNVLDLLDRIERLEALVKHSGQIGNLRMSPVPAPANDATASAKRTKSVSECAAIRRAWAMRQQMRERADLDRRALLQANGGYRILSEALAKAEAALASTTAQVASGDRALTEMRRQLATLQGRSDRLARVAIDQRRKARHAVAGANVEVDRLRADLGISRASERQTLRKLEVMRDAVASSPAVTRLVEKRMAA